MIAGGPLPFEGFYVEESVVDAPEHVGLVFGGGGGGSGSGDSLAVPVAGVAGGYGGLATLVEITQDGTMTSMFEDYGSSEETVRNDGDRREEMMKQVRDQ
ncbi:hypothetical protein NL676_028542 [Syzygium grande]|nr:hypothetical protein NL676_028542 [Syzygium grande]